jgi:hypothetical protein
VHQPLPKIEAHARAAPIPAALPEWKCVPHPKKQHKNTGFSIMPPNAMAAIKMLISVTFYVCLCPRNAAGYARLGANPPVPVADLVLRAGQTHVTRFGRESMPEAGNRGAGMTKRQIRRQMELIENSDVRQ